MEVTLGCCPRRQHTRGCSYPHLSRVSHLSRWPLVTHLLAGLSPRLDPSVPACAFLLGLARKRAGKEELMQPPL